VLVVDADSGVILGCSMRNCGSGHGPVTQDPMRTTDEKESRDGWAGAEAAALLRKAGAPPSPSLLIGRAISIRPLRGDHPKSKLLVRAQTDRVLAEGAICSAISTTCPSPSLSSSTCPPFPPGRAARQDGLAIWSSLHRAACAQPRSRSAQ